MLNNNTSENNLFDGSFFDKIHERIMTRAQKLDKGVPYKLRNICGKDYWDYLDRGEPNQAGLYMSYMTDKGLLPFTPVGKSSDNHRLYILQ